MAWFHKTPTRKQPQPDKRARMEGLWIKCDGCEQIVYKQDVEKNLEVCPKCGHHFPMQVRRRLELVLDEGTFRELDLGLESSDPLTFTDTKKYKERLRSSARNSGEQEAFLSGVGRI